MTPRARALATVALLAAVLAGCSDSSDSDTSDTRDGSGGEQETPAAATDSPSPPEPTYLPRGDLPAPLDLRVVDGRTIRALPFADFAVAAGDGVWVSGVAPGAVRYDAASGRVTARTRVAGEVLQALEESAGEVLVPTAGPSRLLRLDAVTGEVRAQVRLPASPLAEGVIGAAGDTAYVLLDPLEPTIVVVEGDEVSGTLAAPEDATAVRAAFGALWVPTGSNTVERYDLGSEEWTTIPTGPDPRFLDAGAGAVWVMNQGDGSVTRIDGRSAETETIPVTGGRIGGGDLTVGAGAVWLRTDSAVARIDPRTREVTHWLELPPGSGSVAATEVALWITNHDHNAVHAVPLPLPGAR